MSKTKVKAIVVGELCTGKSSFIERFCWDNFSEHYEATVGLELMSKTLAVKTKFGSNHLQIQCWDTAGQERFRALIPTYFRDANIAIVLYDIMNLQSFHNTDYWLKELKEKNSEEKILIALVGNKIDREDHRVVTTAMGKKKAIAEGVLFFECSAKTGEGVAGVMETLCVALIESGKIEWHANALVPSGGANRVALSAGGGSGGFSQICGSC